MNKVNEQNKTILPYAIICIAIVSLFCACSEYFTPWSGYLPTQINPVENPLFSATHTLSPQDSIANIDISSKYSVTYNFSAGLDTTYVISLQSTFDIGIEIIDSASNGTVFSLNDSSGIGVTAYYDCRKSGAKLLRIKALSTYPMNPFTLVFKTLDQSFANQPDRYEPDNSADKAAYFNYAFGNEKDLFQFRRLTTNDTDWGYFYANYGHSYTIRTIGSVGTRIFVNALSKDSVIATDNPGNGLKNAVVNFVCPYSSTGYCCYFYVTGKSKADTGTYGVSIRQY